MALKFLNDGYFAGKVGIGTTSPTRILELKQGEPYLRFNPTTNAAPYIIGAGDGKLYIVPEATYVPTMTFSSGSVGIGTVSPQGKLHINSTGSTFMYLEAIAAGSAQFRWRKAGVDKWSAYVGNSSNDLTFWDGTADRVTFQNGGNVGIGTTSPTGGKLQIEGADDTSLLHLSLSGGYLKGSLEIDDPYFVVKSTSNTTGGIKFRTITGGTTYDRMTILNSGNVGIGTTSPAQK